MALPEFNTSLSIVQCKQDDQLIFETDEVTPGDYTLSVYDKPVNGTLAYGPVEPDRVRDGVNYWYITASSAHGFPDVLSYYEVVITDNITNSIDDERYVVYVNDDLNFENYISRILGLAGHNCRRYNHVWTRGQLISFSLKFYATAALLDAAIAGTSDTYIAHYNITLTYNNDYNRIELSSVKQ